MTGELGGCGMAILYPHIESSSPPFEVLVLSGPRNSLCMRKELLQSKVDDLWHVCVYILFLSSLLIEIEWEFASVLAIYAMLWSWKSNRISTINLVFSTVSFVPSQNSK